MDDQDAIQARADAVAAWLRPAPEPSLADRASLPVLIARCRGVGFSEGQTVALVTYLPRESVVLACELVEAGADHYTAGRISV
jgi:hypothetical protein